MKIKKFQAKNFSEALALVKREMGPDAIILSSEEQNGLRRCVEVTAAVDYEVKNGLNSSSSSSSSNGSNGLNSSNGSVSSDDILQMNKELKVLRNAIEDMKTMGYEVSLPEKKRKIFRYLKKRSVSEDLALRLCNKASTLRELVSAISVDIRTRGELSNKKVTMLIGPTGVGKTTTIAKLAALSIRNKKRIALVNLDTYRIGAIEQIRIYSKIMGVPLDIASRADELKSILMKHQNRDMIFIDTTGRNPKDRAYLKELEGIYDLGVPIETHLLISANSDDDFMTEACGHYRTLPIDCVAFTKVDEAVRFGSIYNISSLFQKPVAYVTNGQRVPQDIDFPDNKKLAGLVLNRGAA